VVVASVALAHIDEASMKPTPRLSTPVLGGTGETAWRPARGSANAGLIRGPEAVALPGIRKARKPGVQKIEDPVAVGFVGLEQVRPEAGVHTHAETAVAIGAVRSDTPSVTNSLGMLMPTLLL
jgi:hypothetical protein